MAIKRIAGRPRSFQTEEEAVGDIVDSFLAMSHEEQEAFLTVLGSVDEGDVETLDQVVKVEYEQEPVDPRTFLLDEYYMGSVGSSMWPKLQDDFVDLFEGGYSAAILSGSIGWGKSFFATSALAYIIYQMSCLANPQEVYGLASGSGLVVALLSATREAARRVPLAELSSKIQLSPYFKEKLPYKIAATMYEMRFPTRKILVVAGSTASAAIGTNVFAGMLDEMAFMGDRKALDKTGRLVSVDKSEILMKGILRRMKSRFQRCGRLPGIMFMVSSKERPVAFIEKMIAEAIQTNDPTVFIREYATWDVKPRDKFLEGTFKIAVGNDRVRSKIDPEEEEQDRYLEAGLQVIEVPEDYRPDFESDLEGSLRDIAGIATESVSPYIHRIEKIITAIRDLPTPVDVFEWVAGSPLAFFWERVARKVQKPLPGGYTEEGWVANRHPEAARYVHIDPALTGDSAGVVIAHIAGMREVVRRDVSGREYNDIAPIIETDLVLRVVPPTGDEIFLGDIRALVYQFIDHGFHIGYASMDSYQSADTLQQFRLRGIDGEVLSVDRTEEPYDIFKTALYEDRLWLQPSPLLEKELRELQRVSKGSTSKFKIDHPRKGSKDLADGVAGVACLLTRRMPGRPMGLVISKREGDMAAEQANDTSWVTGGKVMVSSNLPAAGGGVVSSTKRGGGGWTPPLPFVRG